MTLVVFSLSPRQVTAPGLISYDDYAQFCIYLAGCHCLTNKMILFEKKFGVGLPT